MVVGAAGEVPIENNSTLSALLGNFVSKFFGKTHKASSALIGFAL
jgi:hypothetical protein